jgi:hypothetical protein
MCQPNETSEEWDENAKIGDISHKSTDDGLIFELKIKNSSTIFC